MNKKLAQVISEEIHKKAENNDYLWKIVCNGYNEKLKEYYEKGGKPGYTHNAFGNEHSLIMGALRNHQFDTVKILEEHGETILPHEKQEYEEEIQKKHQVE